MSQVNRCGMQDLLPNGHFTGDDDTCIPYIHMSKKIQKRLKRTEIAILRVTGNETFAEKFLVPVN